MNKQLLQSWLQLLCKAMTGVKISSIHIQEQKADNKNMLVHWPAQAKPSKELDDIRQMAYQNAGTITVGPLMDPNGKSQVLRLAHPIHIDNKLVGAIGVELSKTDPNTQAAALNLIQWGIGWLELMAKHAVLEAQALSLNEILQPILISKTFQEAVFSTVTILAKQNGCKRVSLSTKKGKSIKLIGQSNSSSVSENSELSQHILCAMTEALEMDKNIYFASDDHIHPAHKVLSQSQESSLIFTYVLRDTHGPYGVLTMEWSQNLMNQTLQNNLNSIMEWLGPALAIKYLQEATIITIAQRRLSKKLKSLSDKYTILKNLGIASIIGVVAILVFGQSTYKVGGVAQIQGQVQRALIAPFDGYVANAYAKAGETVSKDFIVAHLEDKDLKLEYSKLHSEKRELDKQYRKALAELDPTEGRILKTQLTQKQAQINLLKEKLNRTQLTASFNGVIVKGDLSRSIGKPVKKGEVLFEIAPLESYRVIIEIPDKVIHDVKPSQKGTLILSSITDHKIQIQVVNITSMPTQNAKPGTFNVEAKLIDSTESLRPGMQGYAKLEVRQASRFWIWTHDLVNWLRYQVWTWLP